MERFEPPHDGQSSPPQCVQYLVPQLPHLYTEKDLSEGFEELLSATRVQFGQLLKMCISAPFLAIVAAKVDAVEIEGRRGSKIPDLPVPVRSQNGSYFLPLFSSFFSTFLP
jgi:hypothetical protein